MVFNGWRLAKLGTAECRWQRHAPLPRLPFQVPVFNLLFQFAGMLELLECTRALAKQWIIRY